MFTPQQIEQISFSKATFGGYDMQSVDEFLAPLTEDYVTLYKENATLKSKMRVLVAKLEEYRQNESSMREDMANSQQSCELMVKETEEKCAQMLSEANAAVAECTRNADAVVAAENERAEEAKRTAAAAITQLEEQLRSCLDALVQIKEANQPSQEESLLISLDEQQAISAADAHTEAVADEISMNLEALVGTTDDVAPKAAPQHPATDSTTSKFNNLQFGRNYDASMQ